MGLHTLGRGMPRMAYIGRQIYRCQSSLPGGRPKVVIVGAGWAGFRFARDLNKDTYDVYMVSPRNHFLFTPLLPSTAVGTLEFRCIQEPVRTIPGIHYYQSTCDKIDAANNRIHCVETYEKSHSYELPYDYLVLAPGAMSATFGVQGVNESNHVYFLKQLHDARSIRTRLIECFERACSPGLSTEERQRLLHFVVIGGGPTSVEFAAELYDFLVEDVKRWYSDLFHLVRVSLVEASPHILNTFDRKLSLYTTKLFQRRRLEIITGKAVKEVKDGEAVLNDGTVIPFGLMVWSTGIKQLPVIESAPFPKHKNGRIMVDEWLRVVDSPNVFAMGDCAGHYARPLPALAQVAQQQGIYLGSLFNSAKVAQLPPPLDLSSIPMIEQNTPTKAQHKTQIRPPAFEYTHLGSMAQVGQWKGVFDSTHVGKGNQEVHGPAVSGLLAFFLWRSAYWTKSVSIVNKILIPMYWFKSWIFGRDISKF